MSGQQAYGQARQRAQEDALNSIGPQLAAGDYQGAIAQAAQNGGGLQALYTLAQLANQRDTQRRADAQLAESTRHNRASEGLAQQQFEFERGKPQIVGSPDTGFYAVPRNMPAAAPGGANAPVVPAKQKDLTANDRTAIQKSEDAIPALQATIDNVKRAMELNPQVFSGWGAKAAGEVGTSGIPGANMLIDKKRAAATAEWDQLMGSEAIKNMSETLKGASTDFEMRKFISIAADTSKPPEVRQAAMQRFLKLADSEMKIRNNRVNQLRSGTYYQPGGGASGPTTSTTNTAGKRLRFNPDTGEFE